MKARDIKCERKKGKKRKENKHGMGEIMWVLLCYAFYDILYS